MPLGKTAILLGAMERPRLPVERYLRHLDTLSEKVRRYPGSDTGALSVRLMSEALFQTLARHHGYGGTDHGVFDDDSFDLTRVIDQRNGASETLCLLYADVARRLDWQIEILRIPGRMLLRLDYQGEREIIDPLGDGRALTPADLRAIAKAFGGNEVELTPDSLQPLTNLEALLRLLAGRKSVSLRERRLEDAATLVEHALLLAPEEPTLWRESGLLYARLDRIDAAISALEEYLRLGSDHTGRYRTTMLIQELRDRRP